MLLQLEEKQSDFFSYNINDRGAVLCLAAYSKTTIHDGMSGERHRVSEGGSRGSGAQKWLQSPGSSPAGPLLTG